MDAIPEDCAITPSGNWTESGDLVGAILSFATTASVSRISILLEPVSAHAKGERVVLRGTVEIKGSFLAFCLILTIGCELDPYACAIGRLLSGPAPYFWVLVLPPTGLFAPLALRCAAVYLIVSANITVQSLPL